MMAGAAQRRIAVYAGAMAVTVLLGITAVSHLRSLDQLPQAGPGAPVCPEPPADILTASVGDDRELARQLFTYVETPTLWCRRLAMFGGSCTNSGTTVDGDKFVCLDERLAPRPRACLVYSFGVAYEWSFDVDMVRHGCEVHAFDPSMKTFPEGSTSFGVQFHKVGLGVRAADTDPEWRMRTLTEIAAELGHGARVVDYLKVDIEGSEWDWLEADLEALASVRQFGMEIHMNLGGLRRFHAIFRRIHQMGFRVIYSTPNRVKGRHLAVKGMERNVSLLYEVVWVNQRRCASAFDCTE